MKTLFVDVGSSNIKWMTEDGRAYARPFPLPVLDNYPFFEVRAEDVFAAVRGIVDDCRPQRLFLSVQMHGYVLLNAGKNVTEYVSWRDERGKEEKAAFSLTKEYGVDVKNNLPRLSLQTQTGNFDEFCTLGSYLAYRLTGNNASHVSDVTPSGFFHRKRQQYDAVPFRLPDVCLSLRPVGNYGACEVYCPVGDQQASVLGATGRADFDGYVLNVGTAAQMCCVERGFVSGAFESRPYLGDRTLCTVTGLSGGRKLRGRTDSATLAAQLAEEYGGALAKLPAKNKILATGGVAEYRRPLIEKVLNDIGLPFEVNTEKDALNGLQILAKEIEP